MKDAAEVRELMQYEEGIAGALMTTEYITFSSAITAEQAINQLREQAPSAETIYYLYVIDEKEHLLGVLSLRELIIAPPLTPGQRHHAYQSSHCIRSGRRPAGGGSDQQIRIAGCSGG